MHLCQLVELIEDNVGVGIAFKTDYNAHAFVVALVVEVGYAVDFFLVDKVGDIFDKLGLVYVVGNLGYDYVLVVGVSFDFGFCAYYYASAAGFKRFLYAIVSVYGAAGGEVGGFDVFHQFRYCEFGIVNESYGGVD